jgi:hypothetical protein
MVLMKIRNASILFAILFSIALFTSIFLMPLVSASSTQQYNNIRLNPYYYPSLTANTNQTMYVYVYPPDNIASISSAIIHFKTFTSGSTTTYTLYVNGKLCGTFLVNTQFANSGQNEVAFDCTDLMAGTGNYTLNFKSSVNSGAGFGWLDLTYTNNQIKIETAGTDYQVGENARVFVRLLYENSNPINLASCNATIYYPNNTKFINQQLLTLLEKGIYYYDFTAPSILGNYITSFDCIFPSSIFVQNRTYFGYTIGASTPSLSDYFPFDDTSNVTINSAWIYYSLTGSGLGASNGFYFNGILIGTGSGVTENLNVTLNQSNFNLIEMQQFLIHRVALSSDINFVMLFVNYTYNNPSEIIRGQNEIHIFGNRNVTVNQTYFDNEFSQVANLITSTNTTIHKHLDSIQSDISNAYNSLNSAITSVNESVLASNSSIFGKLYSIQDDLVSINNTVKSLNFTTDLTPVLDKLNSIQGNISSVNDTIINAENNLSNSISNTNSSIFGKLYSIQDDLSAISDLVSTSNSSIMNKLYGIQDEIASVNDTTKAGFSNLDQNMQNNFTYTNNLIISLNSTINWWESFASTTINFWGNALEAKIDSIMMGNVTVTALVDYDEIAITVMQYLKALQKVEII